MMRSVNDIRERPAGPVDRSGREIESWEKEIDTIRRALGKEFINLDQTRRAMGNVGPALYAGLSLFERRIEGTARILVDGPEARDIPLDCCQWRR